MRGKSTITPRVMIPFFWCSTPFCGQPGPCAIFARSNPLYSLPSNE
jgi:hypothetical protein